MGDDVQTSSDRFRSDALVVDYLPRPLIAAELAGFRPPTLLVSQPLAAKRVSLMAPDNIGVAAVLCHSTASALVSGAIGAPETGHTKAANHGLNWWPSNQNEGKTEVAGTGRIGQQSVLRQVHLRPFLGVHSLAWDEPLQLAVKDADFHRRDLWEAIQVGDYPKFECGVQLLDEEDEFTFPFDVFDATKLWPEELVPVRRIVGLTDGGTRTRGPHINPGGLMLANHMTSREGRIPANPSRTLR